MKAILGWFMVGFGFAVAVCLLVVCGTVFCGWVPNVADNESVVMWWATLFGLCWISIPLTLCVIGLIGVVYHRCFR